MWISSIMKGLILGAGFMYLFDPDRGLARRTQIRTQLLDLRNDFEGVLNDGLGDLQESGRELNAEIASRLRPDQTSDWLIEHRVRAALNTNGYHAQAVNVKVLNGEVVLSGAALSTEVPEIMRQAYTVSGVRAVTNQLEPHEQPEEIAARPAAETARRAGPLPPGLRLIALVGGSLVFLMGLRRGGLLGWSQWMIGAAVAISALKQDELQDWARQMNQAVSTQTSSQNTAE